METIGRQKERAHVGRTEDNVKELRERNWWISTCLVAASERFLKVHKQFCTSRWLGSVRWRPSACMPPEQQRFHGQTILNLQLPPYTQLKVNGLTSLNDGRFVTGANWQHFEHSTGGPQQFLIRVGPHDVDQSLWASAGQNDKLKKQQSKLFEFPQVSHVPSILHLSNKCYFLNKRTLCKLGM